MAVTGFARGALLPDGDVVVHSLRLQQGEVDVHPVPRRDRDQPHAVLQNRVLIGKARGINGPVLGCHVVPARSWKGRNPQ